MSVEAVISTQVIDTTSVGRSLMTAADAAAARTAADAQVTLVSGTNIKTVNSTSLLGSGDIAVGVSGTGSVDNAALRADGTGGATLQNSAFVIADNATASPNNTVNHASLQATGGTTNVSVSIVPKGTGAISLHVPDGTTTGGNARGAYAVDLQTYRTAAGQVASGTYSVVLGGRNLNSALEGGVTIGFGNSASGSTCYDPVAIGVYNVLSGAYSDGNFALGKMNTVSTGGEPCSGAIGNGNTVTSNAALATGYQANATRYGMRSHSAGQFAAVGDAQSAEFQARRVTTSAVATELFLDGSSTRLTIPSGKVLSALVRVVGVKSDGSEVIKFLRDVTIKNVGGTTSLEAAIVTVGTDINVSAATLDLSADNTNDTLKIAVTPPAGTWRWHAIVECANEIAYGT